MVHQVDLKQYQLEWLHSAPITLNKLKGKYGDEIDEELIPYHLDSKCGNISPLIFFLIILKIL